MVFVIIIIIDDCLSMRVVVSNNLLWLCNYFLVIKIDLLIIGFVDVEQLVIVLFSCMVSFVIEDDLNFVL